MSLPSGQQQNGHILQLGASQANAPEILEKSDLGVYLVKHDFGAVEEERDAVLVGGGERAQRQRDVALRGHGSRCHGFGAGRLVSLPDISRGG